MATEEDLIRALRKADAAGDEAAARAIAGRIMAMRQPGADQIADATRSKREQEAKLAREQQRMRDEYGPTGSFGQNLAAGWGQSYDSSGMGIRQLFGGVSPEEVQEARERDDPLLRTGGGLVGSILGYGSQVLGPGIVAGGIKAGASGVNALRSTFALPESAAVSRIGKGAGMLQSAAMPATARGAAAQGAVLGGIQPATSNAERVTNVALGGAAGGGAARVMQGVGQAVGPAAPTINPQRAAAIEKARELGYVLPPSEMRSTIPLHITEGLSGKIQIGQSAATKNQVKTDRIIRKELAIPDDAPLNVETLNAIRAEAGRQYAAVSSLGDIPADTTYRAQLSQISAKYDKAAKDFPELVNPDVSKLVKGLDGQQFDAGGIVEMIGILRESADTAYRAGNTAIGRANKDAYRALEGLIERHLAKSGQTQMLDQFKAARKTIAKTYTVQNALNQGTGSVDANKLAAALKRGAPLSGDIRQVAEVATAFPKPMQMLNTPYRALSPWDWLAAGGLGYGTGNPALSAAIIGRPIVREGLLSAPAQAFHANMAQTGRPVSRRVVKGSQAAADKVRQARRVAVPGMAGYGVLRNPMQED